STNIIRDRYPSHLGYGRYVISLTAYAPALHQLTQSVPPSRRPSHSSQNRADSLWFGHPAHRFHPRRQRTLLERRAGADGNDFQRLHRVAAPDSRFREWLAVRISRVGHYRSVLSFLRRAFPGCHGARDFALGKISRD